MTSRPAPTPVSFSPSGTYSPKPPRHAKTPASRQAKTGVTQNIERLPVSNDITPFAFEGQRVRVVIDWLAARYGGVA